MDGALPGGPAGEDEGSESGWPGRLAPVSIGLAVVLVALVVAGIAWWLTPAGNGNGQAFIAGQTDSGYLAVTSSRVIFIQWTIASDDLSGTGQVATVTGQLPKESVAGMTIPVAGRLNPTTITISFNNLPQVLARLRGGSFTVVYPVGNGTTVPLVFHPATTTEFTRAIVKLHRSVEAADAKAEREASALGQLQSLQQASAAVQSDLATVGTDTGTLQTDLDQFTTDLANGTGDLAAVARDEKSVETEAEAAAEQTDEETPQQMLCADSSQVQIAEDQVGVDGNHVSSVANLVVNDVGNLRDDVTGIEHDLAALLSAETLDHASRQPGLPTQRQVDQAATDTNQAIIAALKTSNSDIELVNTDELVAYTDAAGAAKAAHCPRPGPLPEQPLVS